MLATPKRKEINHHTIKLLIGAIALLLAGTANQLSGLPPIESISESYHRNDWARNVFVGSLFAIFALLLTYNGRSWYEWFLGKGAAFAALGVALFPCGCLNPAMSSCGSEVTDLTATIHNISAAIMFIILAVFCGLFISRAKTKEHTQAKVRIMIYILCCLAMLVSLIMIAINLKTGGGLEQYFTRPVYVFEAIGLIAFGIAWLTASRMLPIITSHKERITFLSTNNE